MVRGHSQNMSQYTRHAMHTDKATPLFSFSHFLPRFGSGHEQTFQCRIWRGRMPCTDTEVVVGRQPAKKRAPATEQPETLLPCVGTQTQAVGRHTTKERAPAPAKGAARRICLVDTHAHTQVVGRNTTRKRAPANRASRGQPAPVPPQEAPSQKQKTLSMLTFKRKSEAVKLGARCVCFQ